VVGIWCAAIARSLALTSSSSSFVPPPFFSPPAWCSLPDDDLGMDVCIPPYIHKSIHPSIHYYSFSSWTAS
jgi:hypothetical protein